MFELIPQKKLVLAPPLSPCFGKARDFSDFKVPQPPQAIGYVAPEDVFFDGSGTLSHGVLRSDDGAFRFDDPLLPLKPVLQLGLDYVFSMASEPEKLYCRGLYTEQKIILPGQFSRPRHGSSHLHVDQLLEDFFREKGDPRNRTDYWSTLVMWSSDFPTEFFPVPFDPDQSSIEALRDQICDLPVNEPTTFPKGTVTLHTGALPHRTAVNLGPTPVLRTWMLMVLAR